jgi:transcriptional regulator with XRE-family HTH domain
MEREKIDGPTLAKAAGCTKQQIWKLRTGYSQMTSKWAARLAPHLGVAWPLLMDPASPEAIAFQPRDNRHEKLEEIGKRINWARTTLKESAAHVAHGCDMTRPRLESIESGLTPLERQVTIFEIVAISNFLGLTTDFLLLGKVDKLTYDLGKAYQEQFGDKADAPQRVRDNFTSM